jgi:hypothetical protein
MNATELFSSSRAFELWMYTVSHAQLLIRSNKGGTQTSRVELLFKDASLIHIGTVMRGISVEIVPLERFVTLDAAKHKIHDRNIYQISSSDFTGYIVASAFVVHEDEREFNEPSGMLEGQPLVTRHIT